MFLRYYLFLKQHVKGFEMFSSFGTFSRMPTHIYASICVNVWSLVCYKANEWKLKSLFNICGLVCMTATISGAFNWFSNLHLLKWNFYAQWFFSSIQTTISQNKIVAHWLYLWYTHTLIHINEIGFYLICHLRWVANAKLYTLVVHKFKGACQYILYTYILYYTNE